MAERQESLIWQRVDAYGLEYFTLSHGEDGWALGGTVVVTFEGRPAEARYEVVCDEQWQTRQALVSLDMGEQRRTLLLVVDEKHHWWIDGQEYPELQGCIDVDLGITPSTNTLPIRRLGLSVGTNSMVTAAWVRFPSLEVQPLTQRYTRLDSQHYRYESGIGLESGNAATFTAELLVDGRDLVIDYANIWQRVATEDVANDRPSGE